MSQADGYVRIVTQNDTSQAQRSTEELGDTIQEALDTSQAEKMTQAVSDIQQAAEQLGETFEDSLDPAPAKQMSKALDSVQGEAEQLGSTIQDSMNIDSADKIADVLAEIQNSIDLLGKSIVESSNQMVEAFGNVEEGAEDTGDAAIKTGDIIKANLLSEAITKGVEKLGELLKNAAARAIEVAGDMDKGVRKIAAATNATAEEMDSFRAIIETVYADNFGESAEDIADSIAKIKQNLGDLSDEELINITESAYALQDVFDYSVDESSRAAKAMMENFGVSAANAFDYIARGAQNGLDYSGELLDSISEYSVQFSKMGLSASDMFTIFASGTENAAWNLDKVGDSVKELAIRAIDGSDTSRQGFEALGFEAESMAERFAEGGITARVAFQEVIAALADIDDPIAQNTAGINLMGTMWEDMGKDAVLALGDISDSAYDCAGALDSIKDVNYGGLSDTMDDIKRQLDLLIEPIGESLVPSLNEVSDTLAEVRENGDLQAVIVPIAEFVSGTLTLLAKNIKLIAAAIAGVTAAVIAFKTAAMITKVIASWQSAALQVKLLGMAQGETAVKTAVANGELTVQETLYSLLSGRLDKATIKHAALNTVMSMNPAGLVAAGIGLLATALIGFSLSASDATDSVEELMDKAEELNQTAVESRKAAKDVHALVEEYQNIKKAADNTDESKKRLAEIQNTLVDTYGAEADQLDLVNGKYEEQLGLLQDIADSKDKASNYAVKSAYYADVDLQRTLSLSDGKVDSTLDDLASTNMNLAMDLSDSLQQIASKHGVEYFAGKFESGTSYETLAKIYEDFLDENSELFDNILANGNDDTDGTLRRLFDEATKAQEEMSLAAERFNENKKLYEEISSGNSTTANFTPGSWIAAEEAAKARKREAERLKQLAEQQEANKELFKQEKADAKYSYDMGIISAGEYYATLAVLRDKYLEENSDEWREVNVELKKYYDNLSEEQKKAYEKQLAEQQKAEAEKLAEQKKADEQAAAAHKQAYSDERSQLEFKRRTNKISEKKYYSELAAIRDKYLDKNSDEWRSAYLETYEYNQRILQENKDALQQLLDDSTDSTLSALDKLVSARDSMTAKLTDFNKTFEKATENIPETVAVKGEFVITTAEHQVESYKMGADSIEDNIRVLEEYGAMLDSLKARGADENTLSSILDMDVSEGMEFGAKLLKMSESEWDGYFGSLERLNKTAAEISAKYYQDQVDDLRENFIDKLLSAMEGVSSDMYKLGTDAAAEFVEGWNQALGTKDLTIGQLMQSINDRSIKSAPTAAQTMAAAPQLNVPKMISSIANIPVYIGTNKLADIVVDITNGKIVQTGKNVLMT